MRFLRTIVDQACLRLGGQDRAEVVLLHGPSGRVLDDGSARPVRFTSAAEARRFSARYLDEAAAWEPVPAGLVGERAA